MPPLNQVTSFQPTPNPNALKCVLANPIEGPIRSYRDASGFAGDPLAEALFGLPGVVGLLISGGWLTLNKSPEADWSVLKPAVQKVLATCSAELPK